MSKFIYLGVFTASAATLAFEVTLVRFFSIILWYHFTFMILSIALLGYALSGMILSLIESPTSKTLRQLRIFSILLTLTIIIGYMISNAIPFDPQQMTWNIMQMFYLAAYMILLAIPFLFSGLIVGLSLKNFKGKSSLVYASTMTGSGLGSLLPVLFFTQTDMAGVIIIITALAGLSAIAFSKKNTILTAGGILLLIVILVFNKSLLEPNISAYKPMQQMLQHPDAHIIETRWNPISRVDVVESPLIRYAPGLSLAFRGTIPQGWGLFTDGANMNIAPVSDSKDFLQSMPSTIPYSLLHEPRILILGYNGIEVGLALQNKPTYITIVEANRLIIDEVNSYSDLLKNTKIVIEEPRSFLKKTKDKFDLIVLPLANNILSSSMGIQGLDENYLYTVEAFEEYKRHLSEGGFFLTHLWLQNPPRDNLRVMSLALETSNKDEIAAFRSLTTYTLIAKKGVLDAADISIIRNSTENLGYDLIYLPKMKREDANVHNRFPMPFYYDFTMQLIENQKSFIEEYTFDVSPTYDDKPYFTNYFRWNKIREIYYGLGGKWQAFLEGGFVVNIVLIQALIVSMIILSPFILRNRIAGLDHKFILFFFLIGLGYMLIEITLIQRFLLFLGQPIFSVSLVVSTLLISSGLGSRASHRMGQSRLKLILFSLFLLMIFYMPLLPIIFNLLLKTTLINRMLISIMLIMPLGFLMGMPFPLALKRTSEQIFPLVWTVNGCASVIGAVLAIIIALAGSFTLVSLSAALTYLLALVSVSMPARS